MILNESFAPFISTSRITIDLDADLDIFVAVPLGHEFELEAVLKVFDVVPLGHEVEL